MECNFDRESPIPLYLQFKNYLLERIESGDFVEGQMFPTELEFQKATGLSRATIRQALDDLENEEYIKRTRGVGTKVSKRKFFSQVMKLTSFSEDMKIRGFVPSSKTIKIDFAYPPQKVVEIGGFDPLEKIWTITRVRSANGIPIGIHDLYIPPILKISPRDLQNMESFYKLLIDDLHITLVHATETIKATTVTKREAELLNLDVRAPALIIWRVTYSAINEVVEVVRMLHDAERYEYKTQLYRD